MAVVADSGGIYALYDADDPHHAALARFIAETREHILIPAPLLGELGYMLNRWLSAEALVQFLQDLENGVFHLVHVEPEDLGLCRSILRLYADLNLGLCDAMVASTAERLELDGILTVDVRHFRAIRMSHGAPFRLLPADAH